MKLNDVITPDQLRERMFGTCGAVEAAERWKRVFDQVEPFAEMIAKESTRTRMPVEFGGAMMNVLVALVDHLQDEEKRIA